MNEGLIKPSIQGDISNNDRGISELFGALAKAQAEFQYADKSKDNPFFKSKYADLKEVIEASRPALTKYGLSVMQPVSTENGTAFLHTILAHSSGKSISSVMEIKPPKNDIQSLGSYITYLRRYTYASLVGVATCDDDDGESAMQEERKPKTNNQEVKIRRYNFPSEHVEVITPEQLEELQLRLDGYENLAQEIMEKLNLKKLADMPKSLYMKSILRIEEIKNIAKNSVDLNC